MKIFNGIKWFLRTVVQSLSHIQLFVTSWTIAHQAFLSFTISWSLLRLMPTELVMPSKHLIFCYPLLLLPSIFPSIRVFSNESALHIRWPKYCNFSFSISPSNEYSMHPWCLDIGFSVLEWMNEQMVGSGAREVSQHVKGIRKDR